MNGEERAKRNADVRARMLNIRDARIEKLPTDSTWMKPVRFHFFQDDQEKSWDLSKTHDSVSIIVYNSTRQKLVFVRQFRPVCYVTHIPDQLEKIDINQYPPTLGLTLELCSGLVDKDKPLVEIAHDELKEECGYDVPISALTKIISCRCVSTETSRQTVFYAEVTDEMHTHPGGGAEDEGELIELVEMSVQEAREYVESEEVQSPPCLLFGISWFLAHKSACYC